MKGKLLLLPNLLNKEAHPDVFFPASVARAAQKLDGLIAESEKEGRAFLKRLGAPFREAPICLLNKHHREYDELLEPIRKGESWGLISDAGLPIIADPGYQLVARARDFNIAIQAFVGPSSIILSLMLSGLPSQNFAFHGYLPRHPEKRLQVLERRSKEEAATQLFIEAPFRNDRLLQKLLSTLEDPTLLCVAWDLTFPTQGVETHSIAEWKKRTPPSLHKKPAIFLFSASAIHSHTPSK